MLCYHHDDEFLYDVLILMIKHMHIHIIYIYMIFHHKKQVMLVALTSLAINCKIKCLYILFHLVATTDDNIECVSEHPLTFVLVMVYKTSGGAARIFGQGELSPCHNIRLQFIITIIMFWNGITIFIKCHIEEKSFLFE